MKCYCNSNIEFSECCEPLISGKQKAQTAVQLMRSRYSAYVLADINYLLNSHYKNTRPVKERKQILQWTKSLTWLGLTILSTKNGTSHDKDGYVEFKALFEENGQASLIHEQSYFIKENGIWFYKSGIHY